MILLHCFVGRIGDPSYVAFATLYLAGLASPTGPGLGRPAPSGATALVCACVPSEPGSGEAVFVIEEAAGLRG